MDLRTFVTLETTLVQRLLKDWKVQSDPIYQKITQACKEQKWDEARRLVSDLDLSDLGTRRKEWIRFLLESFANYGAARAGQAKPLLAGTKAANTAVEQATNQMLMYLEHAATTQVQEQALQLIATDEAAHRAVKAEYSYGIVMAPISPDSEMGNYLAIARALIADDDLAGRGKDVGGDHVTVRYGIQGGYDAIKEYVARQPTFTMMLGQIRIFEPSESSEGAAPVVVDIVSEELHRMHEELEKVGDWKASSFPTYLPHSTLAYIKPEAIEKYTKLKEFGVLAVEGSQYWVQYLTVSDPNDNPEQIWLQGGDSEEFKPVSDFVRRQKADASGRFVTPFVSFDNQGSDQLQLIASLNGSRLATWGFTAEAEIRGIKRYKINPLLDGRVCPFCRLVSQHEFDTGNAREKILEALAVQNPDDLKTVQPWPKVTDAAMKEYKSYSAEDFTNRGWHIPPYHAGCRCICAPTGEQTIRVSKPGVPPMQQTIPVQTVTADTLKEIGINASQEEVDHWNRYLSLSPVGILSKLSGMTPQEILEGKLGRSALQFLKNGDIGFKARGVSNGIRFATSTVLDPYTGTYYLTQADFQTGDVKAARKFLGQLFTSLVDIGTSAAAKELVVSVAAGEAPGYVQLGFVPKQDDWDAIRKAALADMENGSLQDMAASLSEEDRLLLRHLLESNDPESIVALVDLDLSYEGETVGQRILNEVQGEFRLDLSNPNVLNYLKENFAA
jgi:hypothetical protein